MDPHQSRMSVQLGWDVTLSATFHVLLPSMYIDIVHNLFSMWLAAKDPPGCLPPCLTKLGTIGSQGTPEAHMANWQYSTIDPVVMTACLDAHL